ncbi:putative cytoplasmic peptidase PepQ [Actinomycetospora sp. NBRC 106375]|uniref:M24 family metallopeptidase n=1 Tax=Actinomycetospora sp. NBRC 106375 TaxID=3032207 RepID=UPI0024A1CE1C|nr:Xaa-Pro peptidase family protein [Actinomycetospora sp. NBRC 106375]GLZ44120.1 putative cytoplasmic peptidase PepQ [Actinomycetospora sp. NBRC 106375]
MLTPGVPTRPERAPGGHARRRDALRAALREAGLDALLVTDLVNVRYLSGFTGSNAALLVDAGDDADRGEEHTVLATDGRYTTQAAAQTPDLPVLVERACAPALLNDRRGRIGFDSAHVTVDGHDALVAALEDGELTRAPGLVETLRAIKDAGEVDALRQACAAADAALAGLIAHGGLHAGRTEREVARDLEERMREAGAEGPSFDTIVAAGAHAAIPHHEPTDAPLADGDLLTMDFGALVDGYHSDMTRTVVVGTPAGWQRDLHALVAEAAAAGRSALAPGTATRDVDAAARDVITAAGFGEQFVHGLGHGVGLVIHEAPAVSATATATLDAGMTVTVEPGVYLAGRGGVRIEDTLVVTDDGAVPLTQSPRDLVPE